MDFPSECMANHPLEITVAFLWTFKWYNPMRVCYYSECVLKFYLSLDKFIQNSSTFYYKDTAQ